MPEGSNHVNTRQYLVLILLCSFLCSFISISSRDFTSRGEAREALVAQNMFETGNWILPSGYAEDVPSKPPVLHWLVSLSSVAFGEVSEATARLPSAMASLLFIIYFFFFLQRQGWPREKAFMAAMILLTSFEWLRHSSICRVDMLLAVFWSFACLITYESLAHSSSPKLGSLVRGSLFLGLAALSKSPAFIGLFLINIGIFMLMRGESYKLILSTCTKMLLLPVVLVSLWYTMAYLVGGSSFIDKVYDENVARMTGTMIDEPHKHGIFYHVSMLVVGFLPWSFFLLAILFYRFYRCRQNHFGVRSANFFAWFQKVREESPPLVLYATIISTTTFFVFMIPEGKRGVYLLPSYPFWVILFSQILWNGINWKLFERCLHYLSRGPLFIAMIVVYLAIKLIPRYSLVGDSLSLEVCILTLGLLTIVRLPNYLRFPLATPFFLLSIFTAQVYRGYLSEPLNLFSARQVVPLVQASSESGAPLPIYSYGGEFYGLSFYLKQKIRRLQMLPIEGEARIVLREDMFNNLKDFLSHNYELEIQGASGFAVRKFAGKVLVVRAKERSWSGAPAINASDE